MTYRTDAIRSIRRTHERAQKGVADGARTRDRRHHKPELYQLSYCHRAVPNLASRAPERRARAAPGCSGDRSDVAGDRVGLVGLLEGGDVLVAQLEVDGGDRVAEVLGFGDADDRGGDRRVGEDPGERHLGGRRAEALRHLEGAGDDLLVLTAVEGGAELVGVGPRGLRVPGPGEAAAGQRAPRDHADVPGRAQRQHLALLLAVEEVVVVLHRDEVRPTGTLAR